MFLCMFSPVVVPVWLVTHNMPSILSRNHMQLSYKISTEETPLLKGRKYGLPVLRSEFQYTAACSKTPPLGYCLLVQQSVTGLLTSAPNNIIDTSMYVYGEVKPHTRYLYIAREILYFAWGILNLVKYPVIHRKILSPLPISSPGTVLLIWGIDKQLTLHWGIYQNYFPVFQIVKTKNLAGLFQGTVHYSLCSVQLFHSSSWTTNAFVSNTYHN